MIVGSSEYFMVFIIMGAITGLLIGLIRHIPSSQTE